MLSQDILERKRWLIKLLQFTCLLAVVLNVTLSEGKRVCGPNQFRCRNGKGCVAALDVCDSEKHCKDESEENAQFCGGTFGNLTRNMEQECAPGMYRCRFGGYSKEKNHFKIFI